MLWRIYNKENPGSKVDWWTVNLFVDVILLRLSCRYKYAAMYSKGLTSYNQTTNHRLNTLELFPDQYHDSLHGSGSYRLFRLVALVVCIEDPWIPNLDLSTRERESELAALLDF